MILLFHSFSASPSSSYDMALSIKSANTDIRQLPTTLILNLPPRHLTHSRPAQNTLPIYSPLHHHAIFDHLHPCLLTFPHSLFLFPKHLFLTLKSIPQSLSPSPVRHSFCSLDSQFHSHSLCPVSVIGSPISSPKPFLKSSSRFGHRPTHF